MPQIFQVLKCYKCSVFQVHQTKKSNKWECKLCGEKQSMKRHYGLGTGKECRLHVQKLNGIRCELDEINENFELNKTNDEDEEQEIKNEPVLPTPKQSKWTNFVDKVQEEVQEVSDNDAMFLGATEVVLEIPNKKRKFNNPRKKINVSDNSTSNNVNKTNYYHKHNTIADKDFDSNTTGILMSQTMPSNSNMSTELPVISKSNYNSECLDNKMESFSNHIKDENIVNHTLSSNYNSLPCEYIPPKVDKNSKWAQYTDVENECIEQRNESEQQEIKNLFSLCEENDLDDVLGF